MKRPSPQTYVFGNPFLVLGLFLATCFFGYLAFAEGRQAAPAIIALIATVFAIGQSERLAKYDRWKRDWDGLGGKPAKRQSASVVPQAPMVLGCAAWVGAAFLAISAADEPTYRVPVVLFWLGSALVVAYAIRSAVRNRRPRRPLRNEPVSYCLPAEQRHGELRHAYDQLPEYCQRLFAAPAR